MKNPATRLFVLTMVSAALFTLAACSPQTPPTPAVGSANLAYTEGKAGGVLVQTFKVNATVTALEQAARKATLQRAGGKPFIVQVAPGAVNYDQLRVGDRIDATVAQTVRISFDDAEASAEGEKVTANIIALDSASRMATLRFEHGVVQTVPIRADVDMSRHKVGDQVVFHVTEMNALWVEKAP